MPDASVEEVWRQEAPHLLAALLRRFSDFERCEDAVQEALEAALAQWPTQGNPRSPRGWLIRVASRRVVDGYRRDEARRLRERLVARRDRTDQVAPTHDPVPGHDDTLQMLLLGCHPALTAESQLILSLRTVAGLTTAQVADVLYISEATAGQRISRARAIIRQSTNFPTPADDHRRLGHALRALYLMFTQGHTVSRGEVLLDRSLSSDAIRLARELRRALPNDTEVVGLLALMLLTEARHSARVDQSDNLVPLSHQDRDLWDQEAIAEGLELVEWALPRGPVGPYQIQAAIAACHSDALTWENTDWPQILALYGILERVAPSPTVRLNRAVAESMTLGPNHALAGLDALDATDSHDRVQHSHRFLATKAHLLKQAGRTVEARATFAAAAGLCHSAPERRYLEQQVLGLDDPDDRKH